MMHNNKMLIIYSYFCILDSLVVNIHVILKLIFFLALGPYLVTFLLVIITV